MDRLWNLEKYNKNTALVDENGKELTYEQLDAECGKLANAIKERCLIFILCENTIGSAIGYIAALNNHIVPVMVNRHLEQELLDIKTNHIVLI